MKQLQQKLTLYRPETLVTLVAVWKPPSGKLLVASDSRVSFGTSQSGAVLKADFAPKLFSVPVRVKASDGADGQPRFHLDQRIGIAVTGSFFSAQATMGILPEITGRLLGIPGDTDVALRGIVQAIASVYARVAKQVGEAIDHGALGRILVVGYCPTEKTDQVWQITLQVTEAGIAPDVAAVPISAAAQYFGSGASAARDIANNSPHLQPYRVIKQLCDDVNVPTVGGNLQLGAIPGRDFEIFAIQDLRKDDDAKTVSTGVFLAGVELLRADDAWIQRGLYPASTVLRPFLPDLGLLEQRNYEIKPFD